MSHGLDQYVMRSLDEWRFYFDRAKAAMGIKAVDYAAWSVSGGSSASPNPPNDHQQAAARKHARIEKRLLALPSFSLMVIRVTCEDPEKDLWSVYGSAGLGNIAHLTPAASAALKASRSTRTLDSYLDRLAAKLAQGRGNTEDRVARERISRGIEEIVCMVHDDYEDVRRKVA